MSLFTKDSLTNEEYIFKQSLIYLGMRKIPEDKLDKVMTNEDNQRCLGEFLQEEGRQMFLFALKQPSGVPVAYTTEHPTAGIKDKAVLILRARSPKVTSDPDDNIILDAGNIDNEIIFMEMSRNVIDSLYQVCNEVFMPILGNPVNMIGWSELVSKDLMDKFHVFLAYTYVTIGQIKGRTLLPLPANDVTASATTSSKDKAVLLETAIVHWTKQIKSVLKRDPEMALKNGKHPDPLIEVEFWRDQSTDLNAIYKQLSSERIKKVLKFLEQNKSTYTGPFSKLQKEVQIAKAESNENYRYLQTLLEPFRRLTDETQELSDLVDVFKPVMHTILLIWTYSQYYNTPARLVVLIREICNAIISRCRGSIDGPTIFGFISSDETKIADDKLIQALDVCTQFKMCYFEYKELSKNQWKITTNALFVRLDSFSERCQDIMHLTSTIIQFAALSKIEIGNTKGKTLTTTVEQIFAEFDKAKNEFTAISYDIMDIEKREFEDDFHKFKQRIKELERRIASVLTQGFDDCDTIIGKFKLLDSFATLLNRPIIQDELEKKHIVLLELYKLDLKVVGTLFMEGKALVDSSDEKAPIFKNLPPIAGALNWTNGLLERIDEPMDKLSKLSQSIQDREEFKDVQKLYLSLAKNLREYDKQKVSQWEQGVEKNTDEQLDKYLLYREENDMGFIRVNFDPVLVRLLREVKYLLLMDIPVPERAQLLFKRVDVYRSQTGNLEIIADMYNEILSILLPDEKPLLQDRITKMNNALAPGISELRWNTQNIDPFISACMGIVTDVDTLVKKMKTNVGKIEEMMEAWQKPLFERKPKPLAPEDVEQGHQALVISRLEDAKNNGREIHKLLKDTFEHIKPDRKSHAWIAYVDYVNSLVIGGITTGVCASMTYLSDQISIPYNKHHALLPIFDIRVDLQDRKVIFDPPIGNSTKGNGIRDIIQKIVDDFISLSIQLPRLDTNTGDYLPELKDQFQVFGATNRVTKEFDEILNATNDFLATYSDKSFLWEKTLTDDFEDFLNTGTDPREQKHVKINEDGEEEEDETFKWMSEKILLNVKTKQPALEKFHEKITMLTGIKHEINDLKQTIDIGWLRVNATPLINELKTTIVLWIDTYISFLLDNTVQQIKNIEAFIAEVSGGIVDPPQTAKTQKDKDHLMKVMGHLRDVKMIKDRTLEQVGPMKATIDLLKKHRTMDLIDGEDFTVKLENSKTALVEVSEKALGQVKEKILPLQTQEASNIKDRLRKFEIKVGEYRMEFQSKCPYHINKSSPEIISESYGKITEYYNNTLAMEAEAADLNNLETLFDIQKSSYKQLKDCGSELCLLKQMWDLVSLIDFQFEAWKSTLWDKINTEDLMSLVKDMQAKQCNPQSPQNKDIKNWKTFLALNERVKNMNTILPLINSLKSPHMMDRHWKKLEILTGKTIEHKSPKFCLENLVELDLFKFAEEVNEIVDGAAKEAKIEIKLNNIQKVWEESVFIYKEYKEVPILDMGALDETVENVDLHSMELMGMMSSKDVEEFKDKVMYWQKNLKTVDQVITIWLKVQKQWQRLEPIFLASEDIRAQLPDDTRRFEQIDAQFKDLMREARDEPGVVMACTYENREELLNTFFIEIELCEKALFAYLEEKKKIFARFYFVSNQALLDILSNGNNPEKVDEYLGDCFDGMKCLDFVRGDGIPYPSKRAKGMFSKEDEYVPFFGEFTMAGAVENYLCELEKRMQTTLCQVLENAKQSADLWEIQSKREIWLQDYCAQIALLATQIMWTDETIRAFDDLEGGSETAMKEYLNQIISRISALIEQVRNPLSKDLRNKIITIITIDVHERDVIDEFVQKKIQDQSMFIWVRQLRFYMEPNPDKKSELRVCVPKICDWQTYYNYEYVGNCGRLVITPLTDRCYITLTQALNLSMGASPQGPAGTGKTETTKDLGRALGLQVVVFNCSDQMNYTSMAQIFMGLAQTGSWGCFDEFNRISIEVLSVVSTQVKCCLDAIKKLKLNVNNNMFVFMDQDEILMRVTTGFFITMNPGYAGRTELPENLKALFRSCAMVVPDIVKICENMLMSEGFTSAKELSKKFMCLYDLSKSLLSKQIHYDWGLRAVKSVLRQAGGLKRDEPDILEDIILKRGLKDFNWPKIVVEDRQIFDGLIRDLFPGIQVESKVNEDLQQRVIKSAKAMGLQANPEDLFVLKVVQLQEIIDVRHSVFIIGNPGSAKTTIWKTLAEAAKLGDQDTIFDIIDPKAVTSDELFGCMNPKTKEWKDGVLSVIMRDMNKNNGPYKPQHKYKWIILDGDVDPEWIESLNTVMDDNKVLTLVSQERIPLTPPMRLMLEVSHLKNATPATVSRGGVLFVNDSDVGWRPFFDSWIVKYKKDPNEDIADSVFQLALSTYLSDNFIDDLRGKSHITPVCDMQCVQSMAMILDKLYERLHTIKAQYDFLKRLKEDGQVDRIKEIYEAFFVFAAMWAWGASLDEDRGSFSNSIKSLTNGNLKFPEAGYTFDYFYDVIEGKWTHWDEVVGDYNKEFEGLFENLVVPTADTTRNSFLLDLHVSAKKGMIYVGKAGTGKTTIISNYFVGLDKDSTLTSSMNFNSYTDSGALQVVLESGVDKRAGKTYGPPPSKTMIYFLDDMNMPYLDKYGTQSPICLIRQIIDYGVVYDRDHLEDKKYLVDIMFTGCMNPKSGSFIIDLRLTRHSTLVACLTSEREILKTIYFQILDNHMTPFDKSFKDLPLRLVNATMNVFLSIATNAAFMPTAKKFHYQFNLRDFSKIIQNLMLAQPHLYKNNPLGVVRMWAHECHRVWRDRLLTDADRDLYEGFMQNGMKEFPDFKPDEITAEPLLYTSYVLACEGHEANYVPIKDMESLKGVLEAKLEEYNENVGSMNLVLFDQAMEHVSRIARIINLPVGSALCVGVGGSGKQSLSKLSSFILGYDVIRIVVTSSYKLGDLKTDIQTMFTKAGVAGAQLLFILTDAQIADEKFLVYINDLLSGGWIPELFPKDELDGLVGKIRGEAKQAGCQDVPDELFNFFLDKVRKNLHLCLCFSPVGDLFRIRARKFPAVINNTSIDWFFEWPRNALVDVATRKLIDIEFPTDEIREGVAANMAETHIAIGEANKEFLALERRYNYTTPTSFLELIKFYEMLLGQKQGKITDQINRLEIGLQIMRTTVEKVNALQDLLKVKMVDVEVEKKKTGELIEIVNKESADAQVEADAAAIQEAETIELSNAAKKTKSDCDKELAEAIPAMERATEAVNCLEVKSIQELKALANPPSACVDVSKAVLILLKGEKKNHAWGNAQKMMNNPKKFIEDIQGFDGDNIDEWKLEALVPIMALDFFNKETMMGKSQAAAFLCSWVINIVAYNTIFKKVKPLKDAADAAQATADQKEAELAVVMEAVRVINEKVDALKQQLADAEAAKKAVEDEAQELLDQLGLANRLTNGLADENERWKQNVLTMKDERTTMIGDALISAAFVSYIGPFNYIFRAKIWKETWMPDIITNKIPITDGVDPLDVLAGAADQAVWKTEGLPADRVSLENAAVVVSCNRYPLIIDPQLQGQKWLRGREGPEMIAIQLSQKQWLKRVEMAVSEGHVLMIESIGQEIDAILDPLLSKQFVKKGRGFSVRLGSEDVEIANSFKLYLQTKLINPHYKPETAAQCTIINFIVTESGLEDQLLAMVVKSEKPDLEQTKENLVNQQNEFQITLAGLEAGLLQQLSDADPDTILQNTELIESLEVTKKTSTEIKEQQLIAVETEKKINFAREIYRRVAAEGAMLYFMLIKLCVVDHMYQYSLESFTTFFFKAIDKTEQFEEEEQRVLALREVIRMTIYQWVLRGLFVRHALIFRCQLTFRLMQKKIMNTEYTEREMNYLINCPTRTDVANPLKEWLPDLAWFGLQKLNEIEGFENFVQQLEKEAPNRFRDWYNELAPEDEKLPLEWKKLDAMPFQKLLVVRVLRPDRITTALDNFIRYNLPKGGEFVDCDSTSSFQQVLMSSYQDSTTTTPIYFILSPGANPVQAVETLARQQGNDPSKMLHQVALGQGQDVVAMAKLEIGHKDGHWVMLQNVHLMPAFLIELEKKLDVYALEGSNPTFRLFISSDPANSIPIGLLEKSIKLTNEPPMGVKQNLKRAFTYFNKEEIEEKEGRVKSILFALCYFHTVMSERRKFGAKGWNMKYPFNMGDLRDSSIILNNYLENNTSSGKVPWDDLKYLFGEIMYGGHIVDDWDRILCAAYLDSIMNDQLLDEAELFPFIEGKNITFRCPPQQGYEKYIEYIDTECPAETPLAFGMHPNAEIDFRTTQCYDLFRQLQEIQPKESGAAGGGGQTLEEKIKEFMQRVADEAQLDSNKLNIDDIAGKLSEDGRTPYQNAFMQECEYMNILIRVIVTNLADIELAFKGELTMTEQMETLMDNIALNRVPAIWTKYGFTSQRGLASWLDNLKARLDQLNLWKDDPINIPKVTFLNRLFNPQSFLAAIKQVYAGEKGFELNKLTVQTDVMKKLYWEPDLPPIKEGAYVFGMQVEGARWDQAVGQLDESLPKKPFSVMPVVNCRAAPIVVDPKKDAGLYMCPCYKTEGRGATYVFTAQMKTKMPPAKWVIAGVAIILDVEGVSDAFAPGKEVPII